MTYYEDLTPYSYTGDSEGEILNVGWLSDTHPYPQGDVPNGFIAALKKRARSPVNVYRGVHFCELCSSFEEAQQVAFGGSLFLGSGEMRVAGVGKVTYAAPLMVVHYVESHRYLPPVEFIRAAIGNDNSTVQM